MKLPPPTGYLCAKLAVAFLFLGRIALAQDDRSNGNDVSALKAQIQGLEKQQQEYQDRITAMESEMMKSLESKANSGSILNTSVLTDAGGEESSGADAGRVFPEIADP